MRFYIRPGMAKLRLAPLLLAGGAGLCRVQEPGAVHLVQPGEPAPDGAVSTDYVVACVESQRRLPLDLYRHSGPAPLAASPRGRLPFTEAEDAALLRAVRERSGARVSGTALWKELECTGLTRHSWQAMRDRYLRHLRPLHRGELRAGAGAGGGEALCASTVRHCARLFPQSPSRRRRPRHRWAFSRQRIGSLRAPR